MSVGLLGAIGRPTQSRALHDGSYWPVGARLTWHLSITNICPFIDPPSLMAVCPLRFSNRKSLGSSLGRLRWYSAMPPDC